MAGKKRVEYSLICQYDGCPYEERRFTAHRIDAKFCSAECRSAARPSRQSRKWVREMLGTCAYVYPHGERCPEPPAVSREFFTHYGAHRTLDESVLACWKPLFMWRPAQGVVYLPQPQGDERFSELLLPLPLIVNPELAGYCHQHKQADESKPKQAAHPFGTGLLEFEAYLPHPEQFMGALQDHNWIVSYDEIAERVTATANSEDDLSTRAAYKIEADAGMRALKGIEPFDFLFVLRLVNLIVASCSVWQGSSEAA